MMQIILPTIQDSTITTTLTIVFPCYILCMFLMLYCILKNCLHEVEGYMGLKDSTSSEPENESIIMRYQLLLAIPVRQSMLVIMLLKLTCRFEVIQD